MKGKEQRKGAKERSKGKKKSGDCKKEKQEIGLCARTEERAKRNGRRGKRGKKERKVKKERSYPAEQSRRGDGALKQSHGQKGLKRSGKEKE
jgi:hypothetical protein